MTRLALTFLFALLAAAPALGQATRPAGGAPAAVVVVDGMIDNYTFRNLRAKYAAAEEAGAEVLILQINTYGGAVDQTLEITRLLKTGPLKTVAFVDERAISAGSIIALACDEIVMEPGTLIGDAGVVTMGGEMDEVQRAKAESLVLEEIADSAERNGYDPDLARTLVVTGHSVYLVEDQETCERDFVDADAHAELIKAGWQDVEGVRSPLDSADTLLTLRASLAERIGLSAGTYESVEAYAQAAGLDVLITFAPTAGDRVVQYLAGYALRGILMTVFLFSTIAAIKTPGTGVAEVAAVGSLGVLLGVPMLVGLAQWYEVLAIVVGLLLILLEIFVIPGFGVAGISGLLLVVLGLAFTFVGPISLPEAPGEWVPSIDAAALGRGLAVVVGSMVAALLLWAWLGRYLPTLPYANRLILDDVVGPGTPAAVDAGADSDAPPPAWPPVGLIGTARSDLYPGGKAVFPAEGGQTRTLDVLSERGFVERGQKVVVRAATPGKITVRPVV